MFHFHDVFLLSDHYRKLLQPYKDFKKFLFFIAKCQNIVTDVLNRTKKTRRSKDDHKFNCLYMHVWYISYEVLQRVISQLCLCGKKVLGLRARLLDTVHCFQYRNKAVGSIRYRYSHSMIRCDVIPITGKM